MSQPGQGGSIFAQLLELLLGLFRSSQPSQPTQPLPPPEPAQPEQPSQPPKPQPPEESGILEPLSPRVLLIVYNPVVDATTGRKLLDALRFQNPDQLVAGFIGDLDQCSNGLLKFKIAVRMEDTTFAAKDNGYVFDGPAFVTAYQSHQPLDSNMVNYDAILAKYNVLDRIAQNEIDEVWLMGYPSAGYYESVMGGRGAFWCNGPELRNTLHCPRRFVVMGFNYERGVGEMLESFGHRTESILERVYSGEPDQANLYKRLIQSEKQNPGQANVGWMHYAPNSERDYDWGNRTPVLSCAEDWLLFPNLPNPPNYRTVTANDWGNGDIRLHHQWWFKHLPKAEGVTEGVANNWWKYTADPNNVRVDRQFGIVAAAERTPYVHPWGSIPHRHDE